MASNEDNAIEKYFEDMKAKRFGAGIPFMTEFPRVPLEDNDGKPVGTYTISDALMLKKRQILLSGPVTEDMATIKCAELDYLDMTGKSGLEALKNELEILKNLDDPRNLNHPENRNIQLQQLEKMMQKMKLTDLEKDMKRENFDIIYDEQRAGQGARQKVLETEISKGLPPITFQIRSPGGLATAMYSIYDMMDRIDTPVIMEATGEVASAASILVIAGKKSRMAKHADMMVHQVGGGAGGKFSDASVTMGTLGFSNEMVKDIYVMKSGFTHELIDIVLERDTWLTAKQAKAVGFIDEIIESSHNRNKLPPYAAEAGRKGDKLSDIFNGTINRDKAVAGLTTDEILKQFQLLNTGDGETARLRGVMFVKLAQDPRFWTPSLLVRKTLDMHLVNAGEVKAIIDANVERWKADPMADDLLLAVARKLPKGDFTPQALADHARMGVEHLKIVAAGSALVGVDQNVSIVAKELGAVVPFRKKANDRLVP
ncbi:MAG: ATP-dependent Clp protease proteolytic subunit [Pseudomonadota bacterium]